MHVLITGATGMVGGIVLQHCLKDEHIGQVTSFVRKSSGIIHEKLSEIEISDFTNFSAKEEHFKNVDAVYFCLGAYTGQVSDEEFKKITVDIPKAFGDTLKKHSPDANYCFLSGAGADQTEKSRVSFARYKGMAENQLIRTFEKVHIFRPGYIYPVIKRRSPNITYRLSRKLYPLIKLFGSKYSLRSTELGEAIFRKGLEGGDKTIFENIDIIKIISN